MYVGDDTRTLTFVLREVMHYHTKQIPTAAADIGSQPGTIMRVVASPLSAMIRKSGNNYQINSLGMTASRWREIRYVGTRMQFVPLATTGRIDPADITQSGSGVPDSEGTFSPQGSIHPYDALNFVHWRRWTGGNFNVPAWDKTGVTTFKSYVKKSLAYDQEWLADDRFNHCKLTDGFSFDSVPLRVDLETSAIAGNSLFGFSCDVMTNAGRTTLPWVTGKDTEDIAKEDAKGWPIGRAYTHLDTVHNYIFDPDLSAYFQPQGLIAPTAGKDYHEQGWLPNPFAGFTYKLPTGKTEITPGNEVYQINGYIPQFPWFADRPSLEGGASAFAYTQGGDTTSTKYASLVGFDLNYLVNLCLERFLAPIGIVRFPSAYGSMFYWTVYMAHVFQLRKPFLTNSSWIVGRVEDMGHDVDPLARLSGIPAEVRPELVTLGEEQIYQAIGPDPYGLTESPATMSLCDIAPHMHPYTEPRYTHAPPKGEVADEATDTIPSPAEE